MQIPIYHGYDELRRYFYYVNRCEPRSKLPICKRCKPELRHWLLECMAIIQKTWYNQNIIKLNNIKKRRESSREEKGDMNLGEKIYTRAPYIRGSRRTHGIKWWKLNIPCLVLTCEKRRPIVIITSNAEKELPDAFLRRCMPRLTPLRACPAG